jgi:hypothetical protein
MKIARPESAARHDKLAREALERLAAQPSVRDLRPCPECRLPCPTHSSSTCCCGCTADCPDAPRQMSIEPDLYPIETGIAPLVMEFYALRLCPPCWSCEGHIDEAGKLKRLPRVWFHCREISYLGLIADRLFRLRFERAIGQPWQVRTELDDTKSAGETIFSLEPALRPGAALIIANGFADAIRKAAKTRQTAL